MHEYNINKLYVLGMVKSADSFSAHLSSAPVKHYPGGDQFSV